MLDILENHGLMVFYKLPILDVAKCARISFPFQLFCFCILKFLKYFCSFLMGFLFCGLLKCRSLCVIVLVSSHCVFFLISCYCTECYHPFWFLNIEPLYSLTNNRIHTQRNISYLYPRFVSGNFL
jgi:hypothetical protein